jgi:hypothetical protein
LVDDRLAKPRLFEVCGSIAQEAGRKADGRSAYHPCPESLRAGRGEARRSARPLKGLPGKN